MLHLENKTEIAGADANRLWSNSTRIFRRRQISRYRLRLSVFILGMSVKTKTGDLNANSNDLCRLALAHWAKGKHRSAVETAWAAFDLDSSDRAVKFLLADLLDCFPSELASERQ